MIIVRLRGGLGNQLFMYAAARRLSLASGMPLKLDTVSGFKWDSEYKRVYLLDKFNIKVEFASNWESCLGLSGRVRRYLMREANRHFNLKRYLYLTDETISCCTSNLNIKNAGKIYMEGYWQSERYFNDVSDVIRDDLKVTAEIDPVTLMESKEILAKNAVCVGIRRFQEEKETVRKRLLDFDYYRLAVAEMNRRVKDPHFFVITEDTEWAKTNLNISHPVTFISHKSGNENAYKNMWLMTLCKHFIISQGTYHWWGAWLAGNRGKIVMAPNPAILGLSNDYIPKNWITIGA